MNEFSFTDYQRPIGLKNDYRTSYYRGHLVLDDSRLSYSTKKQKPDCDSFLLKNAMVQNLRSEQRRQYSNKTIEGVLRNPSVKNINYMKLNEEIKLRAPPKPLQQLQSVYRNDFRNESPINPDSSPSTYLQRPVKICDPVEVERTAPGYAKYLNNAATTNSLTYLRYTDEQRNGISSNDNITYWTWLKQGPLVTKNVSKVKQFMCEHVIATKCPSRRNEFQCRVKVVPNSGLTTEVKSNYKNPKTQIKDLNFKCDTGDLVTCPIQPVEQRTESSKYGAAFRSLNFVTTGSKKQVL